MKSTHESSEEENIDSDLLSELSSILADTSDSSDSELEAITSKLQNEISSVCIYQDEVTIAENIIPIIEITKFYHTLIELVCTIDFGVFNQIQSVSLNLQEHLEIVENLENYLPFYYVQSKQCRHNLEDTHLAVFELIMDDIYIYSGYQI